MRNALQDIVDTFQAVDPETRLELLLDYSRKLPPLPERHRIARDSGENRVHECMTPVYLFVDRDDGVVHIHADVAEEAPTVRGFVSLLVKALEGASADEVEALPNDLVDRLKLSEVLRMNRTVGLAAVLGRIKREAAKSGANGG